MSKILQLKICLDEIEPEIWRRFLVYDNISFEELHEVIQMVMGWENYHMYEFMIDDEVISVDENEGFNLAEGSIHNLMKSSEFQKMLEENSSGLKKGGKSLDINKINQILQNTINDKKESKFNLKTSLNQLLGKENQIFFYLYDFGDGWNHIITIEKILEKSGEQIIPICLGGERACPPEDCGGVGGYEELMEIRKNKKHPKYNEMIKNWLGEKHDFEEFDVDEVNKRLKKLR